MAMALTSLEWVGGTWFWGGGGGGGGGGTILEGIVVLLALW